MRIAIDLHTLLIYGDLDTGIINYEFFDRLKSLKDEHDLTLRVNLLNHSFSDLNIFLCENNMEGWFQDIEIVHGAAQYLISDRAITTEQFMKMTDNYVLDTDLFQEAVSWSQSQNTIYGKVI